MCVCASVVIKEKRGHVFEKEDYVKGLGGRQADR